jgi:predicted phosphodiesterase
VRIGLLSDVHGNLTALLAVHAALAEAGRLDAVIVAGDLLQGGPRPREVWDFLRDSGWSLVQGNEDAAMASPELPSLDRGHPYQRAYRAQHAWTSAQLDPAIRTALGKLPREYRAATPAGDLLVVHASPRGLDDRCGGPHNTAAEVAAAYAGTGAAAIAFGHWHQHFVRSTPFALLVNVASVSQPRDGLPLAAYSIVTASEDGWLVEQRRVPYDFAAEVTCARLNEMPAWTPDT